MARKPLVRDARNQITSYQQPNPNDAMPTFERNQGGSAYPTGNAANGQKNPINLAALKIAADDMDAGNTEQYNAKNQSMVNAGQMSQGEQIGHSFTNKMNKSAVKIMNPDMRLFMQSIKNAGGNKLATGAKTFHDAPGYFDTQGMNPAQQDSLSALLKAGLL